MTGYVGLTDPEWFSFLSSKTKVDEVNFWQPHGNRAFRVLQKGAPFFFKLRAPQKAIVGFGFFERFESLPAWLAWKCFEEMNGASNFEAMVDRIVRLRHEPEERTLRRGNFQIGCILITAPVFFAEDEWVAPPMDWAKTGIQQGKSYDLSAGEGHRILAECMERAHKGKRYWNVEPIVSSGEKGDRYGAGIMVRPRLV